MPPQGHPVFCASDNNFRFTISPYLELMNQYSRAQPATYCNQLQLTVLKLQAHA